MEGALVKLVYEAEERKQLISIRGLNYIAMAWLLVNSAALSYTEVPSR